MDAYLKTASCNGTKGGGWCRYLRQVRLGVPRDQPRCSATTSPYSKTGGDMFADLGCPGCTRRWPGSDRGQALRVHRTEEEVRAAIQAAGQGGTDLPALAACLRDPAVPAPGRST